MVLSSRNVQLLLGYYVSCIRKEDKNEGSGKLLDIAGDSDDAAKQPNGEQLIVELQPAERSLKSQILEVDLVLWTVGSKPLVPPLHSGSRPLTFPINGRGQAETDETLRVKGHPRIFAIGDSAALRDSSGRILPATAQVAFQQADFAGWNLWAAINNRPLLPFRFIPTKKNLKRKQLVKENNGILRGFISKRGELMKIQLSSSNDLLGLLLQSNNTETVED